MYKETRTPADEVLVEQPKTVGATARHTAAGTMEMAAPSAALTKRIEAEYRQEVAFDRHIPRACAGLRPLAAAHRARGRHRNQFTSALRCFGLKFGTPNRAIISNASGVPVLNLGRRT
eukprot:SAG31_NODE_3855_length_3815_cov_12.889128_4_plen_118_part_00